MAGAAGSRAHDVRSSPRCQSRLRPAEAAAHEVLLCVRTGSTMADGNRFKFEGDSYYLKSPAEMRALFAA